MASTADPRTMLRLLLTFNGGYVDAAGFLGLHGLFTAHVTGNFITLGAALVFGTTGVLAKLLALPIFVVAVVAARLLHPALGLRGLLSIMLGLLLLGTIAAVGLQPFPDDGWQLLLTGAAFILAMGVQNALQRLDFPDRVPTTVMTGAVTQVSIGLVDLVGGRFRHDETPRLLATVLSIPIFALGCALAAVLYRSVGLWCFAVAPLVGLAALLSDTFRRG